jgi:anti-sigma-K factor RskA
MAACLPYPEVKHAIESRAMRERPRQGVKRSSASNGVFTSKKWFHDYMKSLGFAWTATMGIGTGCTVHLRRDELPYGRLVCMVSRHACAVVDGVLFDDHDCSRNGTRCVYGYWRKVA